MTKNSSLDHALHNEKVCKYIQKKSDFADWIITTAFYSALHFVTHKIFPMNVEHNGKRISISNFDIYHRQFNPNKLSKHEFRKELVELHCSEISDAFEKLYSLSYTARYVDYRYGRDISDEANKNLKKIKDYCS